MALPRVLVEILTPSGSLWFSDGRYADPSISLVAQPRIGRRISFGRKASTIYWAGAGRATVGLGDIELINSDGALDGLLAQDLRDRVIRVRLGLETQTVAQMMLIARGIVESVRTVGETAIRIVVGDAQRELDRAVQTATVPSGPLQGRPQPVMLGFNFSIPALAIEPSQLRFGVHDGIGALSFINLVADAGVELTQSSQWLAYSVAPTFGFRLLQSSAGVVLAEVMGPGPGVGLQNGRIDNVVRYLLETRFGWSSVRSGATALGQLSVDLGAPLIGRWVNDGASVGTVLEEVAATIGGWWSLDVQGNLQLDRLRAPSGTPVISIQPWQLAGELQAEFDEAPGLSSILCGRRNWHVMTAAEQAGSVRDTDTGASYRADFRVRVPFSVAPAYQRAIARRPAGDAAAVGMPSLFANVTSTSAEATRRAALWGVPRWWYRTPVALEATLAASLPLGSVVRLTSPRYGLQAGRLLRVMGVRGEIGSERVELDLWGEGPDPDTEKQK